ncbi:MAG: hypothetical protein K2X02_05925 [Alphaproteobacteria bacterium]|nr:hypothetical protein [Alphaproteobacteria bacterium]
MRISKYFRSINIFNFFAFFLFSIALHAIQDEIEIKDTGISMNFVNLEGKIYEEFLPEFLQKTGAHGNITTWDAFKASLDSKQKKGIAGEVAAKFFFKTSPLSYQILEDHYIAHIASLKADHNNGNGIFQDEECTTKKGPDNGIDGIFFLKDETIKHHSYILINESKFRSVVNLSKNNFGFVIGSMQQSYSSWNRERFYWPTCLPELDYDKETVLRTATLLNRDGIVKLYEIKDKNNPGRIEGEYASEAPTHWNIRKAYEKNIASKYH